MSKLWGGRFTGEADVDFQRINASLSFDHRLVQFDILCAKSHLETLLAAGVVSREESARVSGALDEVARRAEEDPDYIAKAISDGIEDVHSFVESEVVSLVGDVGFKLNTGRSRNDQVATDLRLYVRDMTDQALELLRQLQSTIIDVAEANLEIVFPGYTHLQKGQPVLFAHYLLAYFEMFDRDRQRFKDSRRRTNTSPLGAAALAGTNYPLDRELQARLLGFESICGNSMDAVSDRDFVAEFLSTASLVMVHLSRISEDLILYSTAEFAFVGLSDQVTTGSSLLPQKKNPDALELIRGKTGRVFGNLVSILTVLKGLPMTYNKDLQEDKEPLFDTVSTLFDCLSLMRLVLRGLSVNREATRQAVKSGFVNATELADYLVSRGATFRQAHELVGRIVLEALGRGSELVDLTLDDYRKHSPLFEEGLYEAISLEASMSLKNVPGGTSTDRVREALVEARRRLTAE
jgi:argininosuccinate lyase